MRCSAFIKDPVLSSMHYAQRWPFAVINSMLIMGQASAKKNTSLAPVKSIAKTVARNAYWVSNDVGF